MARGPNSHHVSFILLESTYKLSNLVPYIANRLSSCASSHDARTSPSAGAACTISARTSLAYGSSCRARKWNETRSDGLSVSDRSSWSVRSLARSSASRCEGVDGMAMAIWPGGGGDHTNASHVLVRSAIVKGMKDMSAPMNAREGLWAYNTWR